MTRYRISKEQLEMVVENFVMEAAATKATVKNHIPSQGAEAKKHVKNKMSGNMVEKGEGVPSASPMKKKNPHATEAKKHVSNNKLKHTNKAKVVKENELEEGWFGNIIGTSMSEEKARKVYDAKYRKHLSTLAKQFKTDEPTMEHALIQALMETGGQTLIFAGANALQWDAEKKKFIKKGSKLGGMGGMVGG